MEEYIKKMDDNKTLMSIYYSLLSEHTNDKAIFTHLEKKCLNQLHKPDYKDVLQGNSFKCNQKLKRVITCNNLINYFSKEKLSFGPKKNKDYNSKSAKEIENDIKSLQWNIGQDMSAPDSLFTWVTNSMDISSNLPLKLGVTMPKSHIAMFTFSPKEYELFIPSIIEGNDYIWFLSNPNTKDKWGKSIDILKVSNLCKNYVGESEAIVENITLEADTTIDYIGYIAKDEQYNINQNNLLKMCFANIENKKIQKIKKIIIERYTAFKGEKFEKSI